MAVSGRSLLLFSCLLPYRLNDVMKTLARAAAAGWQVTHKTHREKEREFNHIGNVLLLSFGHSLSDRRLACDGGLDWKVNLHFKSRCRSRDDERLIDAVSAASALAAAKPTLSAGSSGGSSSSG